MDDIHPLDAECNRAWERFAVALIKAGVNDDDVKAISEAALNYAMARIKAREGIPSELVTKLVVL